MFTVLLLYKLVDSIYMIISINDDFDLNKIMNSGQCFRVTCDDNGTYRFITGHEVLFMCKKDKTRYEVSCEKDEWNKVWRPYFDLDTDYSSIRRGVPENDRFLNTCADEGAGIRILNQDKWEMLISFIISQRKSIPAIRSCVEKICEAFGAPIKADANTSGKGSTSSQGLSSPIYTFPKPEALANASEKDLQVCGTGYRTSYILDAAQKVASGELDLEIIAELPDEDLFEALTSVRGVGTKVANCVMLFGYHRIGRAPVDTWILKVIDQKYGGINPFDRYGDVAGIMQQYMFYGANKLQLLKE